ncbi:MAG TPA: sensor histidine kinase [Ktedonobacterales bacterium]|nr:sensor histidine kinase [Ktedonobacterales bacterium]
MMSAWQQKHPLRRFFLVWVSLTYLWGLVLRSNGPKVALDCLHGASPQLCSFPNALSITLSTITSWPVAAFTGLLLLYGIALWISLAGWIPWRFSWLYFLLQGVLVLIMGLVVQEENMVLSLYLVLTLQALSMVQYTRLTLVVASGLLGLFTLSMLWSLWTWEYQDWGYFVVRVLTGTDYTLLLPFALGYLVLYVQQVRAHTRLEAAHGQLQAAAAHIEALTLLMERQRMARELHDTLAQSLAGLIRQLDIANLHLTHQRPEQAREIVQEASAAARGALTAARCAIDDLRAASVLSEELIEAVQGEIAHFTQSTGIACTADLEALAAVPAPLGEHVQRAISEGLTNVARHAQAHQAWVCTAQDGKLLTIDICDDGVGFAAASVAGQAGHYGLLGLRERARLAGGQVEISSTPGAGTSLHLQFPLPQKEALT